VAVAVCSAPPRNPELPTSEAITHGAANAHNLTQLLGTVNATTVNNDDGKPGEFLAELCNEAADRPRQLAIPLTSFRGV
jgi:hypothetical protein